MIISGLGDVDSITVSGYYFISLTTPSFIKFSSVGKFAVGNKDTVEGEEILAFIGVTF
jgi:hypothetical protein